MAWNPIPKLEWQLIEPVFHEIDSVIELGCKANKEGTYKSFFIRNGIDHTSIDLNGWHGSLKLDLSKPIILPKVSCVTNFGTSEHVGEDLNEQGQLWENVYNFCKPGGWIVSIIPMKGNWPGHGRWYPIEETFEEMAKVWDCEVEHLRVEGGRNRRIVCVRLRRGEKPVGELWPQSLQSLFYWHESKNVGDYAHE